MQVPLGGFRGAGGLLLRCLGGIGPVFSVDTMRIFDAAKLHLFIFPISRIILSRHELASYCDLLLLSADNQQSSPMFSPLHLTYIINTELQSFYFKTQRNKDTMFFFVSGRYKEQLKLLYKVHKVFCRKVFFLNTETQRH